MERVRNSDMVVSPVRALGHHDVGNDARQVGLISDRGQIEKQIDLLVEVIKHSDWPRRKVHLGSVLGSDELCTPLDLTNAFEIPVECGAISRAQLLLQSLRAIRDQIKDAIGLARDFDALLRRGLAE